MILSDHAKEEMLKDGISEEEVRQCLEHGELIFTQAMRGEMRYIRKLDLKDRSIVVIHTFRDNDHRVITTYAIRNEKWQK
jgi:hypothetical protein